MDAISNLIFNSLAKHEGVRLPGVGSLTVVYTPASMDDKGNVIPPHESVIFCKEELESLMSVPELIEYSIGADRDNAGDLYMNWIARMRDENGIVIERVGEIKHDKFHIYPELAAVLNPEQGPVQVHKRVNNKTVIIWLIIAVLIGGGIASFILINLSKNDKFDYSKNVIGVQTVKMSSSETDQKSQIQIKDTVEVPVTTKEAYPAKTDTGNTNAEQLTAAVGSEQGVVPGQGETVYYVVAGVYSTDANAEKFISQAQAQGSTAQFTKVPWKGKILVSAYTSKNRSDAEQMRRKLSDKLNDLWVKEEKGR